LIKFAVFYDYNRFILGFRILTQFYSFFTHFSPLLDSSNESKCIDQFGKMKIFIKAVT